LSFLSAISRFLKPNLSVSDDPSVVVRAGKDGGFEDVHPREAGIEKIDLPEGLFVKAGTYDFENETYDCSIPGVYRFAKPHVRNAQRIVWDKEEELNNLLFCSLLAVRGNSNDDSPFHQLEREATNRLLSLTCGPLARFVKELVKKHGVRTRIVSTHTLQSRNSYNNGHTLLEYQPTGASSWVAFDVDKKCIFRDGEGSMLDAFELCWEVSLGNPVDVQLLSKAPSLDLTNFFERSTGYNYQFLEMNVYGRAGGFRPLIDRICNVPYFTLPEGLCFGCWNDESRGIIQSQYPTARILGTEEFRKKFYE
jgi:hypothetical protein